MSKRLLIFLLCLGCWVTLAAQQPDITVEVERVNLLITVVDKNGRFVTGLPRDRFEVREDGKRQTITNFANPTDLPLRIGLLIDTSASIRTQLEFEKEAATRFFYSVIQPQDLALLVEFDRGVSLLRDFTNRPSDLAAALRGLKAGGGTAILDAIHNVAREKMTEGTTRRVIILVSDGLDRNSHKSHKDVLALAQSLGVTIYAIGTNRFGADQRKEGEKLMRRLCRKTGGRSFFPYSEGTLEQAFELINQELRSQYILAYSPTNRTRDGSFRKIRVKLRKSGGLTLRYRDGYYAPPAREGSKTGL
ncbi:MAG: VWA domain-containing protein [Acidobacteriota bacterium]